MTESIFISDVNSNSCWIPLANPGQFSVNTKSIPYSAEVDSVLSFGIVESMHSFSSELEGK